MGAEDHRKRAAKNVSCAVITVSDTRTEATDESGKLIRQMLEAHGHSVRRYAIVRDEVLTIESIMRECVDDAEIQAIVVSGGTGVSGRDCTVEAVRSFAEKELPGFGELFRMLSYQEIGSAAFLSRAFAFVTERKAVFVLPGSKAAVRLATEKLIAPELGHLLSEANR